MEVRIFANRAPMGSRLGLNLLTSYVHLVDCSKLRGYRGLTLAVNQFQVTTDHTGVSGS